MNDEERAHLQDMWQRGLVSDEEFKALMQGDPGGSAVGRVGGADGAPPIGGPPTKGASPPPLDGNILPARPTPTPRAASNENTEAALGCGAILVIGGLIAWGIATVFKSWWAVPVAIGLLIAVIALTSVTPTAQKGAVGCVSVIAAIALMAAIFGITAKSGVPAPTTPSNPLREGVERCLDGQLPTNVDPQTGQTFCDVVDDVQRDIDNAIP